MPSRNVGTRMVSWLLAISLVCSQAGVPSLAHAQSSPANAVRVDQFEATFAALEAAVGTVPRDTFDPEAILDEVDLEAEALFAWVRDHTTLVPYRGALRGPVGVLMDRLGNSLDRALLLSELLQLLGYDTRLARGQLSEAQAEALLAQLRPLPAATSDADAAIELGSQLQAYAAEFGIDREQLEATLERVRAQEEQLAATITERVPEQTDFLAGALAGLRTEADSLRTEQLAALQDHWWVQYQEGADWLDLDPSLPAAEPGDVLAEATETVVVASLSELGEELLHSVQIRAVLECFQDGALIEQPLLASDRLLPSALLGQRVALQHIPARWPQEFDLAAAADPGASLRQTALEQDTWVPTLRVGPEIVFDLAFDEGCKLTNAQQALDAIGQLGDSIGGALEGAGGFLGGLPGGEEDTLTAMWLEYVIRVPGKPDETIRRQIFDLLGPAARAADPTEAPQLSDGQRLDWRLALLGETDILPLASQLSPQYVEYLTATRLIAQKKVLLTVLRDPAMGDDAALREEASGLEPIPGNLYTLALAREGWRDAPGVYLDRPNILSQHLQTTLGSQGQPLTVMAFDIVANGVGVHPAVAEPFAARLRQGVLDTNAEALLGALACRSETATSLCTRTGNAAEAFVRSRQQGLDWLAAGSPEELAALELAWPEDGLARVRGDLEAGYTVVVPSAPLQQEGNQLVTWWRVDPRTGQSLGMGDHGWGTEYTQYAMIINLIGFAFCEVGAVRGDSIIGGTMLCVVGIAFGVGAALASGHTAGILGILAAVTYGFGGLGL